MTESAFPELSAFLSALGADEEPLGLHYADGPPEGGLSPKAFPLPSAADEAAGKVDFPGLAKSWSCVFQHLRLARVKKKPAWFSRERFGCLGGAFFLGFQERQLEAVAHLVSTGIPGVMEGERYLESPEAVKAFFQTVAPRPAPRPVCVVQPLSLYGKGRVVPELVIFFCRPEMASGLHQLAAFVTGDMEAVMSPFGAGCANLVAWPFHYLERTGLKAVLGGWDPSDRKFLAVDEITFSMPLSMFQSMLSRFEESFLTAHEWQLILKKMAKGRKV